MKVNCSGSFEKFSLMINWKSKQTWRTLIFKVSSVSFSQLNRSESDESEIEIICFTGQAYSHLSYLFRFVSCMRLFLGRILKRKISRRHGFSRSFLSSLSLKLGNFTPTFMCIDEQGTYKHQDLPSPLSLPLPSPSPCLHLILSPSAHRTQLYANNCHLMLIYTRHERSPYH